MRILALETTERIGRIAAACGDNLLCEKELRTDQRTAQSLAPGLAELLDGIGWQPADVDLVAVSAGPGSFTGLRIGITAAKTFAYAIGARVMAVDTLDVIAEAAPDQVRTLSVAVDAQRGDVVAASFRRADDGRLVATADATLLGADAWLAGLAPGTAVSGPVLRKLAGRLPSHVELLDSSFWRPRAALVARIANRLHAAGRRDDLWSLVPRYSRRSAAEEKAEEKWEQRSSVRRVSVNNTHPTE